jgi:hypothetical protein
MATAKSKPQITAARNNKSQHDRKLKLTLKSISISQKTNPASATARKTSPKAQRLEKPVFKGKSICSIGTYKRNGKVVSHDDISKYVRLHGGEYVKEVTDTTTHLICSVGEFERKESDRNVNCTCSFNALLCVPHFQSITVETECPMTLIRQHTITVTLIVKETK